MIFLQAFIHSIKLPNRNAIFKLNRIGMDVTVIYMFILLILVSVPSFISQWTGTDNLMSEMNFLFFLIYFFIFFYLPLTGIVFLFLSLMAYIAVGIAKLMERKLRFSILWKMSAYTTTIPALVYTGLALFIPLSNVFLLIYILFTFIMLLAIISVYPKRKKRRRK
ncbi:DUF1189 family protein [Virgibacillus kimchii]